MDSRKLHPVQDESVTISADSHLSAVAGGPSRGKLVPSDGSDSVALVPDDLVYSGQVRADVNRNRCHVETGRARSPRRWQPAMLVLSACGLFMGVGLLQAAPLYEEAQVPQYTLPEPLVALSGEKIDTKEKWEQIRRPELLTLFRENVYGYRPGKPIGMRAVVRSVDKQALGGKAIRKQIGLLLAGTEKGPTIELLIYSPAAAKGPVPIFLGLNFNGNQTVSTDPGILMTTRWVRNDPANGVENNRATEKTRGSQATRWQIEKVIDRGYATATAYYGDIEPDHKDGWKEGVRSLFPNTRNQPTSIAAGSIAERPMETFAGDDWGAIAAWGWGLSRAMDYIEVDPDFDASKVILHGHSRLGKTSLWAGAEDPRFAIVISNESGEGGAAIARRQFGERTADLNKNFPHWFCDNYLKFDQKESELPVDAHLLVALSAPRPVYIASAAEDLWADPKGEFLAGAKAEPVYQLYGFKGIGTSEPPAIDQPVGDRVGYHNRAGKHDVLEYDWDQFLKFADRHLLKK